MAFKLLITGPESTGKTSLALQLSKHLDARYVPEYARSFLELNGPKYTYEDILQIAKKHVQMVEAESNHSMLILDSYLLNLKIWTKLKFNKSHQWIDKALFNFQPDAVLLMKPDLPWVYDPLREDEFNRDELFQIYQDELKNLGWPYKIVSGTDETRFQNALVALNELKA